MRTGTKIFDELIFSLFHMLDPISVDHKYILETFVSDHFEEITSNY